MKSLISTIMNNSLFNFVKRLAIVCVFLSISISASSTSMYYDKLTITVGSTTSDYPGKGRVYVLEESVQGASVQSGEQTVPYSTSGEGSSSYDFHYGIKLHPLGENSYFVGWNNLVECSSVTVQNQINKYTKNISVSPEYTNLTQSFVLKSTSKKTNSESPHAASATAQFDRIIHIIDPRVKFNKSNPDDAYSVPIKGEDGNFEVQTYPILLNQGTGFNTPEVVRTDGTDNVQITAEISGTKDQWQLDIKPKVDTKITQSEYTITITGTGGGKLTLNITINMTNPIVYFHGTSTGTYTYTKGNNKPQNVLTTQTEVIPEELKDGADYVIALKATPSTGYKFFRWKIIKKNGDVEYEREDDTSINVLGGEHIYLECVEASRAFFIIKGYPNEYYVDLQEAINDSKSRSKVVVVATNGELEGERTYTINDGVTLLVPGDDNYTVKTENYAVKRGELEMSDQTQTWVFDCYRYLRVRPNTTINVDGGYLAIYSRLYAPNGGHQKAGTPTKYGELILGEECHVVTKNGGVVHALGYITGHETSSVHMETSSILHEAFQFNDFRGGSQLFSVYYESPFPVGQYYLQNVEVQLIMDYGATERLSTSVTMQEEFHPMNAQFIGKDNGEGMFCLTTNTQFIRTYDPKTDRVNYKVQKIVPSEQNDAIINFNYVKLPTDYMGIELNSSTKVLPLQNNLGLELESGVNAVVNYAVALMPGFKMTINAGAKLTIKNEVYVYDGNDKKINGKGYWGTGNGSASILPLQNRPGNMQYKRTEEDLVDAQLIVNGIIEVNNGALYTTSEGANICSTTGGTIQLSKLGTKSTTSQLVEANVQNINLSTPNLKLHNNEEKQSELHYTGVVKPEGFTISTTNPLKYVYYVDEGLWKLPDAGISNIKLFDHNGIEIAGAYNIALPGQSFSGYLQCELTTVTGLQYKEEQFTVSQSPESPFTIGGKTINGNVLQIPISYTNRNINGEYKSIVTINSSIPGYDTPVKTKEIVINEEYQPSFSVSTESISLGETTVGTPISSSFSVTTSSDNVTAQTVGSNAFVTIEQNKYTLTGNNSNMLWIAEITPANAPFTFSFGEDVTSSISPKVIFNPTEMANGISAVLTLKAQYTDALGVEKHEQKEIQLLATANRRKNTLEFATFPDVIYPNTKPFDLLAKQNSEGKITIKLDLQNVIEIKNGQVNPLIPGKVTVIVNQEPTREYEGKQIERSIEIKDYEIPILEDELCLDANNYTSMIASNNNVTMEDDVLTFSEYANVVLRFKGVVGAVHFTTLTEGLWTIKESDDTKEWTDVVVATKYAKDTDVRLLLKPTTQFIRIETMDVEGQKLTNLCLEALRLNMDVDKLYMPYYRNTSSETSTAIVKITYASDNELSIVSSDDAIISTDISILSASQSEGYAIEEIQVTSRASSQSEYTIQIKSGDQTIATLPIYTYLSPQPLPIITQEWNNEHTYYYYMVKQHHVQWNINKELVFLNPGNDQNPRMIVLGFYGYPNTVQFESLSPNWKIQYNTTSSETSWLDATSIDKVQHDEKYTIKATIPTTANYVKIAYDESNLTAVTLSNLVIKGDPTIEVIEPYGAELWLSQDKRSGTFTLRVTNLSKMRIDLDNTKDFSLTHKAESVEIAQDGSEVLDNKDYPFFALNESGEIQFTITWDSEESAVNEGNVYLYNDETNKLLATIRVLGKRGTITNEDANTGIWTGVHPNYTLKGKAFENENYTHHEVKVNNAFAKGKALFDYLFIYGETTTTDREFEITEPSTSAGSNAKTPYYIYKKGVDGTNYEFVEAVENANSPNKTRLNFVDAAATTDEEGHIYYSIRPADGKTEISIYMTGFCPYATTGYTKYDEGVWYIQGEAGEHVHIYLEDCHIYSRNKTELGNSFVGRKGNVFTEQYVRGSGGVFVLECITNMGDFVDSTDPFQVTVHTRGDNLLKSNYGCFFNLMGNLRAFQVSSPIQVHLASAAHVNTSKVTLEFDDKWPVMNTGYDELDYERTNGLLSLQKQVNNAPSIDLGNKFTTVNFKGGRIELQNAAIVSTNYKTTLAISHRSGEMGAVGLNILLAYGMGTDATGGTVNFYDGTTSVIPMTVPEEYRGYYLMDTDAEGKELATTSCLRCPKQTYVYGGSHGMLRACRSVTSRGGAPTDGPGGKPLGKYEYTLITPNEGVKDEVSSNGLAIIRNFPNDELKTYYSTAPGYLNKTYGLQSVSPIENKLYFWIPEGYNYDVKPEKDATLTTWRTCMTEISASYAGKTAGIGGDLSIESDEVVKYLLYCQIDENIHDVITQKDKRTVVEWNDKNDNGVIDAGEESEVEKDVYTYEATVKDPTGQLGGEYFSIRPTGVGSELQNSVTNDTSYQVTDRVYYITTAKADTWMNFTAPFDVENIYVMETFNEDSIRHYFDTVSIPNGSEETEYTLTAKYQAKHNADFAAFFAMAMALGSDKPFEDIYDQYIDWAMSQDGFTGNKEDYDTRGKTALVHYDGSNFPEAHFYLYRNDESEDWETNDDMSVFQTQWQVAPAKSGNIMLEKGTTYSMLFPYSLGVEMEERRFWDYWTGKFLIFESTLRNQSDPHEIYGREEAASLAEDVAPNHARLSGNKSFAQFNTEREDVYLYSNEIRQSEGYIPNEKEEIFDESTGTTVKVFPTIEPTTTFLIANIESDSPNSAPIRRILRTGEIIYGTSGNGTTTGGNVPTVGGGNDLFITSIAGGINIAVAAPQYVRVLSSTGALLFSGMVQTSVDVTLPANGVYVIAGENEVQKILY